MGSTPTPGTKTKILARVFVHTNLWRSTRYNEVSTNGDVGWRCRMNIAFQREARIAWEKLSTLQKLRARRFGTKLHLGSEQREGWSAPIPMYLFWCAGCGNCAKDYVHGFEPKQYLNCSCCGARHPFITGRQYLSLVAALFQLGATWVKLKFTR